MAEAGDRIRLVRTTDPWTELQPGALGTVVSTTKALGETRIEVNWDCGSRLTMLPEEGDVVEVIR